MFCILASVGLFAIAQASIYSNPSYPSFEAASGIYYENVSVSDPNVCQLRVDIVDLVMANPDPKTGLCMQDSLEFIASDQLFSHSSLGIPPLCGSNNNGQHIYLGNFLIHNESDVVTIKVTVRSRATWSLNVTQITCDDPMQAPSGCLQYFTQTSATIRSFNFGNDGVSKYFYPQNYLICIKRDSLDCEIQYVRDPTVSNYRVSVGSGTNSVTGVGSYGTAANAQGCGTGQTDNGCGETTLANGGCLDFSANIADYLLIPQGRFLQTGSTTVYKLTDYYCGGGMGQDTGVTAGSGDNDGTDNSLPVISQAAGIWTVRFNVYDAAMNVAASRLGFSIVYTKRPICTSIVP